MSDTCGRCGKAIYANEKPQRITGNVFHDYCFKCKECGTKLTMRNLFTEEGEAYCLRHKPYHAPNQTIDSTMEAAMSAPDSSFGTTQFQKSEASSGYGAGALNISAATKAPKATQSAGYIDRTQSRHTGEGEAP